MQICQVSGHHDKMASTKTNTQNDTKTRTTLWRIRRLEKLFFVFFGFVFFIGLNQF